MQIATLITTGQIVEIVTVRGGWTTIRTGGVESKVRNSQLTNHGSSDEEFEEQPELELEEQPELELEEVVAAPAVTVVEVGTVQSSEVDIDERKNGSIDPLYLNKYRKTKMKVENPDGTAQTRVCVDTDDKVARILRGLPLHIVYIEAASAIGTTVRELMEQYKHLNPGMQRMNLGNRMRKAFRDMVVKSVEMEVEHKKKEAARQMVRRAKKKAAK